MISFKPDSRLLFFIIILFICRYDLSQAQNFPPAKPPVDTTFNLKAPNQSKDTNVYYIESINLDKQELDRYVWVLKETTSKFAPGDLKKPEWNVAFKPLRIDSINCPTCTYWGKLLIKNDTKSQLNDLILYFGGVSKVNVHIYNEKDSLVSTQQSGKALPADKKKLISGNRMVRIPLSFLADEQLTIYFKFENIDGYTPDIHIQLSAHDFYTSREYGRKRMIDGLFIGFLLVLIVFNMIFFITTRDVAFFYQFVFVVSVLVFMIDIMDYACDFPFLRNHPILFEPINFIAIILLNISYLYFVNKFIGIDKVFPKWINILKRLVLANLVLGSLIIIFYIFSLNERITDTAIALVSAIQYGTLLILLFQLYRIRDIKSYFILLATLFLIGGVIVNGVAVVFEWGVQVNFSKFIVIGNLSFFFFGLAYRMKLLKDEEHEAIRLKENQESKNKLYANITHEFRTPLTVIQGMAQQIESVAKTRENSKMEQAIQLIKSNGNRLLHLVNTILDLAKLESGRMELNLVHGDIISYLRYVVQLFETFADSRKISLRFLTELDAFYMDFDKEKIQAIVSNLISNAIKFTRAGGKIFMSVKKIERQNQSYLQIEVKDTGEGIAKSELGNIFNRFFQAESSTHKSQGSGLGLALVHELVRLMDGQIAVESELGKGTTFQIIFPVLLNSDSSVINLDYSDKMQDRHELVSSSLYIDAGLDKQNGQENSKLIRDSETIDDVKPLLLIVDDSRDIIYYLQTILEKQYTIETAYNGKDGIALALEIIPDIIISDLLMPDKDGYELCDTLKNDERTSHIPIILLTAKTDTSARITGLTKGADAYLAKPFNELELQAQLENLLRIRKLLQERYKIADTKTETIEEPRPIEDAFLTKLNALIRDKMDDEDFGILQMCRSMQMSRTQLHRKITALTGKSTSIYLRYLRLQKAKQLLKKPEMNISEIAFAVGFSDPNYFTRTFTEEFGITPTGFRAGN